MGASWRTNASIHNYRYGPESTSTSRRRPKYRPGQIDITTLTLKMLA